MYCVAIIYGYCFTKLYFNLRKWVANKKIQLYYHLYLLLLMLYIFFHVDSCFFACLTIWCWNLGILNNVTWQFGNQNLTLPRVCCCFCLFIDFSELILLSLHCMLSVAQRSLLGYFSGQLMIGQRFLEMPATNISSSLFPGAVRVYVGFTFNIWQSPWKLHRGLHFLFEHSLKVSLRWERRAFTRLGEHSLVIHVAF